MYGLCLLEPTELYNLLNEETFHPRLSDSVFMLLLGKIITLYSLL